MPFILSLKKELSSCTITLLQSDLVKNLLILSQKEFANPKSLMTATSTKSKLTRTQKQIISMNLQETFISHDENANKMEMSFIA